MNAPQAKVLLLELTERTSAKGNSYLSGWLGKASLVGFLSEENGKRTWKIYASEPRPKAEGGSK